MFTNFFVGMSGEMVPISMIVYKNQYYTVIVLDSQAWSPRIITNLPICAEVNGPQNTPAPGSDI